MERRVIMATKQQQIDEQLETLKACQRRMYALSDECEEHLSTINALKRTILRDSEYKKWATKVITQLGETIKVLTAAT